MDNKVRNSKYKVSYTTFSISKELTHKSSIIFKYNQFLDFFFQKKKKTKRNFYEFLGVSLYKLLNFHIKIEKHFSSVLFQDEENKN